MLPESYSEDDPDGVQRDTLVEARIEIKNNAHQLRRIYVGLDGLADDNEGVWSDEERETIRLMQESVKFLAEIQDDRLAKVEREIDRIE